MRVVATHGGAVAGIDDVSGIKAQCRGEAGQGAGEGVVCGCRGKIPLARSSCC